MNVDNYAAEKAPNIPFSGAFSDFSTGVALVTTVGDEGRVVGTIAQSFGIVSAEPPIIFWSIRLWDQGYRDLGNASDYFINILADSQMTIAERYGEGSRYIPDDKYLQAAIPESAIVNGSAAWLKCSRQASQLVDQNVVIMGRVLDCGVVKDRPALKCNWDI